LSLCIACSYGVGGGGLRHPRCDLVASCAIFSGPSMGLTRTRGGLASVQHRLLRVRSLGVLVLRLGLGDPAISDTAKNVIPVSHW